ncbi:unnamed protein product, partial [marine sediment metagenome]
MAAPTVATGEAKDIARWSATLVGSCSRVDPGI